MLERLNGKTLGVIRERVANLLDRILRLSAQKMVRRLLMRFNHRGSLLL